MLELVKLAPGGLDSAISKLCRWSEQPLDDGLASEMPAIEHDLDCRVGSFEFREHVDLSGFFPQERDHAWTRGARGFIGLRLGEQVRSVELAVRSVNAAAEHPAVVKLSSGTTMSEIEVATCEPRLLSIDIPRHLACPDTTIWLQLSTSRAGRPIGSPDPRILGVCLMSLKVDAAPRASSSGSLASTAVP